LDDAGGLQHSLPFHFDDADAAQGICGRRFVEADRWDILAYFTRGLEQGLAWFCLDLLTVNREGYFSESRSICHQRLTYAGSR
jgi:hypothetical protein